MDGQIKQQNKVKKVQKEKHRLLKKKKMKTKLKAIFGKNIFKILLNSFILYLLNSQKVIYTRNKKNLKLKLYI